MERFLLLLHNKKVLPTMEDKLFLREAKGGHFSMNFVYQYLTGSEANPFPFRSISNS